MKISNRDRTSKWQVQTCLKELQDFAEIEDEGKHCFEIQNQNQDLQKGKNRGFNCPQIKKPGFQKKHQFVWRLGSWGEPIVHFPNIPDRFLPQGNSLWTSYTRMILLFIKVKITHNGSEHKTSKKVWVLWCFDYRFQDYFFIYLPAKKMRQMFLRYQSNFNS